MDRERKEKEILYEWSCRYYSDELKDSIFPPIDKDADSYFIKREDHDCCLREYGFRNLPELKAELVKMWNNEAYMDAVIKPVLAGALKNRTEINMENGETVADKGRDRDELPQYIYNF